MPDNDSVYLFHDDMLLDQTLPLTLADVALHRHSTVNGCDEVNRDPLLSHGADAVLDPDGDQDYAREMRYGKPVPMQRCESVHHRGRRDIPAGDFIEGDTWCRKCRLWENHLNKGTSKPEQGRHWKRLRTARGNHFR